MKAVQKRENVPAAAEVNITTVPAAVTTAPEQTESASAVTVVSAMASTSVSTVQTTDTVSSDVTGISETQTTETTAASTTTATTTEPIYEEIETRPVYEYISAPESPNAAFYQDRLTVVGDSIAYGFNAYGYIPFEHNLATESVSIWNFENFTFDKGGGEMGIIDAAGYVSPSLIYMSIGMNDLFSFEPSDFAAAYKVKAEQILEKVPDTTLVIGSITPVSADNYFTDNETIRSFNSALENMVLEWGNEQVYYFDAYSVLADPYDLCLAIERSGGDGIHLGNQSYSDILNTLFNFLDDTPAMKRIQHREGL